VVLAISEFGVLALPTPAAQPSSARAIVARLESNT
jgi:hypothetical protein